MSTKKATESKIEISEKRFPLIRLRRDCVKIFNVSASTFDGATIGLDGEHSVEEIKNKIKAWQGKTLKKKDVK